ncbi:LacI family DNA-binding transcriptional regulator [Terrimonas rubra]|uniref:LacI family DNA-binding transcriptional regulator n=1 Tax=Terrimonas rubra TaxID=1035890 RepID=A0ABW6A3I1_9BACT
MTQPDITIYDIAKKLSLSAATVSRALNNNPAINAKTRKRVNDMAMEMGYRSNNFASNLRKGNTHTIGVLVHELKSNFITSVLAGIEKVTTEAGYDIIIAHSSERKEKEIANAHNLFHKRVDGLIASLAFDTENLDHFDPFFKKGIPVIFFDRVFEHTDFAQVIINNYRAAYDITSHLAKQGCKRIMHVTASLERNVYSERFKGYQQALKDNKLNYDKDLLITNQLSEEAGIQAAMQILAMRKRPDAVFVSNDFCAAVLMRTLQDNGVHIPKDIAVAGFNNDAVGKIVSPKLTTIDYPGIEMGEITARNLVNHLQGVSNLALTNKIIIKSELIIRESTLKKKPSQK